MHRRSRHCDQFRDQVIVSRRQQHRLAIALKGIPDKLSLKPRFDAFAERCDTAAATCDWIDDGCHPNADGHRALAEAIADALDGACPRGRNSE